MVKRNAQPSSVPAPPEADRRTAVRYSFKPENSYLFATLGPEAWPAVVVNISTSGIAVMACHSIEPGMFIAMEVVNRNRNFTCKVLVRIVHLTKQECGVWIVGGAFVGPLTTEELQMLLMPS